MDPPNGCRPLSPCLLHHPHHHHRHLHLHNHHHHRPLFLCPRHHHHKLSRCHHHHVHPNFAPFPQNQEHAAPDATLDTSGLKDMFKEYNPTQQALQEQNHDDVALEEEDDDDPIFVLTDEWKEFFAKSEAKRKLERKQAKKANRK